MIKYGLPFWLYNDEPPFVLATLKMIQLKSILPVLHQEAFKPFFYYPPYISYLFLPVFLFVILLQYLNFQGNISELQSILASDPSVFFIAGRFVMIILSLLTIYLIYRITESLTKDRWSSFFAAFFFSTSLMHISLSVTGKQWMPILLFYTLGLFILSKENWSIKKRFYISATLVGIGTGISTIIILFSIIMISWYIFYEKKSFIGMFKDIMMYKVGFTIITLAVVPVLLYPASLGFVPDMTLHDSSKTILGFITSPFVFPFTFIMTEPVLSIFFIIGLIFGLKKYRKFFLVSIVFIISYSFIFYTFFRFEYRFLLPLTLLLSIGASYGINIIKEKFPQKIYKSIFILVILILILISLKMSTLGAKNDSRVQAKEWLERNTTTNQKIIVYANLMRLPNSKSGIIEQEFIDPTSLRTNDKNEKDIEPILRKNRVFNALNLYTVKNDNFYNEISNYAQKNNYEYLVIAKQDFLNNPGQFKNVKKLTKKAIMVAKFGNNESGYSLSKTEIGPTLKPLFTIKEFGPEIEIYRLNRVFKN